MQLMLIENAIDSLRFGKEFYRRYMELGDDKYNSDIIPGYLKMVVFCFHHCVELLNKKLLMDIDSKLIISSASEEDFDRVSMESEPREFPLRVEYLIASESHNFRTIDYIETIKSLEEKLSLGTEEKRILIELGEYRNRLVHFGMDKTLDFYEVLRTINDTIRLVAEYYYDKLKVNCRKIENYYEEDFEQLNELLQEGEIIEREAWATYFSDNFMEINYIFSLLQDKKFELELEKLGYSIELQLGKYSDSDTVNIKIFKEGNVLLKELYTLNIPRLNVTVLKEVGYNDVILFVINHLDLLMEEPNNCFKYYKFKGFNESLDYQTAFWEYHVTRKQGKCEKVKFSEEVLRKQIKNYLSKRFK